MNLKRLQELCLEAEFLNNPKFIASLEESLPYVKKFCNQYSVSLIGISLDTANFNKSLRAEPLYIFSDELGGYNIKGIKASIN